jgi:1-deoxy-D-xylulose-5-phosphate reductoisomerase
VLNALNEAAVSAFLQRRIAFLSIPDLIERGLAALPAVPADSLEALLAADAEARRWAEGQIERSAVDRI